MFPRFAWYGVQIERQLRQTAGLVGYRVRSEFFAMTFVHLSVWESEAAIRSFVHAQPHRRIMESLVGKLGDTAFRYWSLPGSELPLAFERELHRLSLPAR